MSATINITTGTGTATVTLSTGARGPAGTGGSASISDTAYDATSWNGVTTIAPSKNAVRDKLETMVTLDDTQTITGTKSFSTTNNFLSGSALILQSGSEINFEEGTIFNYENATAQSDHRNGLGLGTAATTASTAYATAAQGSTANTALQPADIASGTITPKTGDLDFNNIGEQKPLSTMFVKELYRHQSVLSTNQQLTLWTFGDSMMSASRLPFFTTLLLHQKVPVIGYALEELNTSTVSGTVVSPPANSNGTASPELWDVGKVWKLSTSAVIRIQNSNGGTVGMLSSKAIFYCSKQSGGGTATVDYSRDGTTWINMGTIDTNGTAGELARAEFTPAAGLGHYTYRINATGGPVT